MRIRLTAAIAAATAAGAVLFGAAQAAAVPGQGTWETRLQTRDLDGNGQTDAFYDPVLNISWLRDATVNGPMTWTTVNNWADNLVFGGYDDWRLPTRASTGSATSELAQLLYVTLGNKSYCDTVGDCPQTGWSLTNTGDFQNLQNLQPSAGLSGPDCAALSGALLQLVCYGAQNVYLTRDPVYAVAVRPGGAAAAVPEPQTCAMLLAGLLAIGAGSWCAQCVRVHRAGPRPRAGYSGTPLARKLGIADGAAFHRGRRLLEPKVEHNHRLHIEEHQDVADPPLSSGCSGRPVRFLVAGCARARLHAHSLAGQASAGRTMADRPAAARVFRGVPAP